MSDKRYWLIEGEPALAALEEYKRLRRDCMAEAKAFTDRVGATGNFYRIGEHFSAIEFKHEPDESIWRPAKKCPRGYYSPKRNSKAARAVSDEFRKLRDPGCETLGQLFLGARMLFIGYRMTSPGLDEIGGKWIVVAREDRSAERESERWKPIDGLRELKPSEYHALKEAHDEASAA